MKNFLIAVCILLFIIPAAQSYPLLSFLCLIEEGTQKQQIYFTMEEADLAKGIGTLTLSKMQPQMAGDHFVDSKDCGAIDGPCRIFVSGSWVTFLKKPVSVKLRWEMNRSYPAIDGLLIDLGSGGQMNALTTQRLNDYSHAPALIYSNLIGLNHPKGIKADCSYFKALGPKPALTGSN
jgi:hypothetical protein